MHFGKRLEQDLVPDWRPHYLQYKLLKKHIKELEASSSSDSSTATATANATNGGSSANGLVVQPQITYGDFSFPGPNAHRYSLLGAFKPLLLSQVDKVNRFTLGKVTELQNRLLELLRTKYECDNVAIGAALLERLRAEAKAVGVDLIALDKFIRQNCIAMQKIVKKFDKRLKFDVAPWFHAELMENAPFLQVNLDTLLIALSDVWEHIGEFHKQWERQKQGIAGKQEDAAAGKGISAQSFERKNCKYWVRAEHLMAVKVAILENLPVYMFDRKPDGTKNERKPPSNYLRSFAEVYGNMKDHHSITSIYFDNDQMDVYKTRMDRAEGAQLFRIRWYGDAQSLAGKEYIFMERKTHHESWIMAKSVKERFPLKPDQVQPFIQGQFVPSTSMQEWMKPDSTGLRLIKTAEELEKAKELSAEIQEDIVNLHLKPTVRTIYDRTAFQSRDHNQVRVSIDTQLTMVNERMETPNPGRFPWCRDMVKSTIPPSDVLPFPYCILEVKLNCETHPEWIDQLLGNTDYILERNKFSKFLTGTAYLHYDRVPELPYWFKEELALDPRNRFLSMDEREKLLRQADAKNGAFSVSSLSSGDQQPSLQENHVSPHHLTVPDIVVIPSQTRSRILQTPTTERTPLMIHEEVRTLVDADSPPRNSAGSSSRQNNVWQNLRRRMQSPFSSGGGGDDNNRNGNQNKVPAMKPIRSNARIKIEPKTSFANERTLIQWVSAASLMITLATLIITSGSDFGFRAGFVFFPLAFVILVYASIRYQYRAWAFRYRRQSNHDDLIGPMFLVFAIASAMGVIVYLMFQFNAPLPKQVPVQSAEQGCEMLSAEGVPAYFGFSDVVVNDKQEMFASGPFAIAHRNLADAQWSAWSMPGEQIQSIDFHPTLSDTLVIGVEKPGMQVKLVDSKNGTVLRSYDLTKLMSNYDMSLKAMIMVPSPPTTVESCPEDFRVMVADAYGSIYTISTHSVCKRAPSFTQESYVVQLVDVIPGPRVTVGLIDEVTYKTISSLHYDAARQHLYVLLSESRKLRVMDLRTGEVVKDWYLPGTSTKWSGVHLSEAENSVYLSQSIPGNVWKFRWRDDFEEEARLAPALMDGSFPGCANAYEGDLGAKKSAAASDRFRGTRVVYVEDF